jgi:8-oxo-dGTP pyrophosphatase MutT (NUDIX family)
MVRRATFKIRQQAIIIHKKRALLLKYSDYTRKKEKWDFPGGHLVHHETAFDSLQREVKEETGLVISAAEPLDTIAYDKGLLIIYVCKS